jgi:hypothetical protein
LAADRELADRFTSIIYMMPGGGKPVVGEPIHGAEVCGSGSGSGSGSGGLSADRSGSGSGSESKSGSSSTGLGSKSSVHSALRSEGAKGNTNSKSDADSINTDLPSRILEYPLPVTGMFITPRPPLAKHPPHQPLLLNGGKVLDSKVLGMMEMEDLIKKGTESEISIPTMRAFAVNEELDPGHRHFSSMHWLYPSTFAPDMDSTSSASSSSASPISSLSSPTASTSSSTSTTLAFDSRDDIDRITNQRLMSAAKATMASKRESAGGYVNLIVFCAVTIL